MYGRDPWGGPLEIAADSATDDDRSRNLQDYDRAALSRPLDETQQSWLLGPGEQKKKKYVDLGCIIVSRKIFVWTVGTILAAGLLAGFITLIVKTVPRHRHRPPPPDNYTLALNKGLMFFNAQRLQKYEAAGELNHVKDIIKWGTDYFLKTFNHTADTIDRVVAQVGKGDTTGGPDPNDHYCWMRPEDIDYERPVTECHSCSDLAAEMAAALASASIVFKDNKAYSQKLVHGAKTLFKFSRDQRGRYSVGNEASIFYNSTGYWDEFIWGATWLYYATGNSSYLQLATTPGLAKHAGAFWGGPFYGVLNWDNKLAGTQVSAFESFKIIPEPWVSLRRNFEDISQPDQHIHVLVSTVYTSFNRTRGGLIQLNHGAPQPLQYVVNAAFLATVFSDYMKAADTPGWYCGPHFYSADVLREFAETQMNYILGKNPRKMSYVVGFGNHYPKHVHHRGASIPKNKVKYNCKGGWKWRDSKPNPNTIVGAMVAGPDRHDGFHDVRSNYNYTEPTLAGNAGLVAALVALSGDSDVGIDKNTIFSAVPPMFQHHHLHQLLGSHETTSMFYFLLCDCGEHT
ncbi:hypothetical protein DH2020_003110 [Rehmannia glutinosa]|uniref:Endoglucanase n=1 Tax=Rehmannia glutinosa TaxID=99300 RepID=A0ABR0XKW6_REHGL